MIKTGIVLTAIGVVLILATLIFSEGYDPSRTFLGNIQYMEIVLREGEYIRYYNLYIGRSTIPTKYPFLLSIIVAMIGIVMIILSRISKKSD